MATALDAAIGAGALPACCRVAPGTTADLAPGTRFDAVLYVDVLEHIEDDAGELERVARHIRPGGVLVVVAPAHPWLYSPFDAAIGHHRRYTRASLARVAPPGLGLVELGYLDSVGLLASAGNRLLWRRRLPTAGAIAVWDQWMVPLSARVDRLFGFRVGRSVLAVWRAPTHRP